MVDFLVIGSVLSVTYIESFDLVIQKRKMIGYNRVSDFIGGDKKFGNICWITNIRDDYPPELVLSRKYVEGEYKKFDNSDILFIEKTKDIPYDYDGVMGVPITFLDKWNPGQFDIVDTRDNIGESFDTVDGSETYNRILIRRRKDG